MVRPTYAWLDALPTDPDALGRSGIGVARSDVLLGATAVLERGVADSAGDPPAAPSPAGVMRSGA